jgi:hypothetical protein
VDGGLQAGSSSPLKFFGGSTFLNMKFLSITFAGALALSAVGGVLAVKPDDSGNPKKQYVCHRTGSDSNPWVIINVGGNGNGNGSTKAVSAHTFDPHHNNKPNHEGNDTDFAGDDQITDVSGCEGDLE